MQRRALRGERLSAARDGKNIKDALERALQLDPALQDAFFGIGVYHYYAAVAPTAAKVLRWLLFLPGGDRAQGLGEMLRARDGGQLLRSEADYQLHVLYLWHEQQPERARDLGSAASANAIRAIRTSCRSRPRSTTSTCTMSLAAAVRGRRCSRAARAGHVAMAAAAEARARPRPRTPARRAPTNPTPPSSTCATWWVRVRPHPTVRWRRRTCNWPSALDRLGQRDDAVRAYRAAIDASPAGDPLRTAVHARTGLRVTPDAVTARAYRLSVDGWRAFERGQFGDAGRALSQALSLRPGDQVARVRPRTRAARAER